MSHRYIVACALCLLAPLLHGQEPSAPPAVAEDTSPTPAPADYSIRAHWLCLPGEPDACAADLATTVIEADGHSRVEAFHPDPRAPVDCFYVYPTVSRDPGVNAALVVTEAERGAVVEQAARFASRCRLYAPLYRQVTLAVLRSQLMGRPMPGADGPAAGALAYGDVRAAWDYYLRHYNRGRGVVLLGHSQGSFLLARLLREEIEGKPVQTQLVSALLLGARVLVPSGADVGGDFDSLPLCRRADQTGCIVSYATFRDRASPPPGHRVRYFAYSDVPDRTAACVNPGAPGTGSARLHAYLPASGTVLDHAPPSPVRWAKDLEVTTPFVSLPGLLSATCVVEGDLSYLAVHVGAGPQDARTADIPGDVYVAGAVRPEWGLHLADVDLALGNLIDLVGTQSTAWLKGRH